MWVKEEDRVGTFSDGTVTTPRVRRLLSTEEKRLTKLLHYMQSSTRLLVIIARVALVPPRTRKGAEGIWQ